MNNDNLTYDTVYIVDDDKLINLTHFQLIRTTNIAKDIRVFSDPLEALSELSVELRSSYNCILVLLDVDMKEINGFEFLDSLLAIKVKGLLDIVMVTSSRDYKIRQKSIIHPLVNGYIRKPLTKKQILEFAHNNTLKCV